MKYTCKLCQQIISTSKDGIEKAEKRNWECLNCYSVIAKKKYPKINRSNTVFSNMGLGLGDQVLAKNLVMFYQEDNPSENITVLKKSLSVQQVKTYLRASKYFFSDVNDHNLESIPKGKIVYYFKLTNEIKNFFAQGRELKLWFKSIKPQLTTKERIILEQKKAVIVHARFIDKNDNGNETSIKKNMSAEHFQKIIDTILEMKKIPVLVGNDKEIPETKTNKNVIDFRNKLMLEEIAWIMQHGILFVGKDSGLNHVASCIKGLPLIAYGFHQLTWMPFTKNPKRFWCVQRFNFNEVIDEIKFRLRN